MAEGRTREPRLRRRFSYDAIYTFQYKDPKTIGRLPVWDGRPLMIPLFIGSNRTLGLNLHWVSPHFRLKIINYIIDMSSKIKNKKKLARLTYEMLKSNRKINGALRGVRVYLHNRVKHSQQIPKEDVTLFNLRKPQYQMVRMYNKGANRRQRSMLRNNKTRRRR